ncbi:OmpA family protein [Sphingobium sp. DEHP117]|uniref:flagellar motor protein MotB n=1 Tax=Sphingobium sp. DEHP117 TaxID=2993436 RepID=UPI0027D6A8EF|nr:flagellar motor protein MotB [Sphingobium sp. DEHP117]MDQ4420660.1 OmpA family protein [Sphingobium sp. DEHP117]
MAASDKQEAPVVIRRVKKVVGGGHHGGAWKVAYADFVTAMMAFFMLLWLISNPDKEKLKGLAEYFTPGPPSAPQATGTTSGPSDTPGTGGHTQRNQSDSRSPSGIPAMTAASPGVARGGSADVPSAALRVLAQELKVALDAVPQDHAAPTSFMTDMGRDELRVSLTDTDRQSMFQGSSANLNAYGRNVLARVAAKMKDVKVNVAVEGHTDGAGGNSDANWQLSGARALAARNALIASGVAADRFTQVVAMAATRPVYPDQPDRPENRRITIVLLADKSALPGDSGFAF